jgi:hypothetical protein
VITFESNRCQSSSLLSCGHIEATDIISSFSLNSGVRHTHTHKDSDRKEEKKKVPLANDDNDLVMMTTAIFFFFD